MCIPHMSPTVSRKYVICIIYRQPALSIHNTRQGQPQTQQHTICNSMRRTGNPSSGVTAVRTPAAQCMAGAGALWRSEVFLKAGLKDLRLDELVCTDRLNIVNKGPWDDLLGAAAAIRRKFPGADVCVHYSLVGPAFVQPAVALVHLSTVMYLRVRSSASTIHLQITLG